MTLKILTIAATLLLTALAGCTTPTDPGSNGDDNGQVAFYVKDAPGDEFESVFVSFHQVQVHKTGGENASATTAVTNTTATTNATVATTATTNATMTTNTTATTMTTSAAAAESGWITIVDTNQTVDLKAFQGDARAFLGDANISVGKYTQIRIHVTEAYGILNGTGARVNFSVPSDKLKVTGPWEVTEGQVTLLIVDFELEKSIHQTGQGKYSFKPVMKLSVEKKGQLSASDTIEPTEAARANKTKAAGKGKPATNSTATTA